MMSQSQSPHLTLDISSLFSVGDSQNRPDPMAWLNNGPGTYEPLFTLIQPLEVVGVTTANLSTQTVSWGVPSVSVAFKPTDSVSVRGRKPDVHVCEAFQSHGQMVTSVDTLSRSIQLIDLDPFTVMDVIGTQNTKSSNTHPVLDQTVRAWQFDELDTTAATQARQLLIENVRRHERTHVTYSLNPQTALWKELELHYRWLLLSADPSIWTDLDFLGRFLARYGTPSTYITELLAILQEEYTTDNPAVRNAVETRVAAHQGGAVGSLLDCFRNYDVDTEVLLDTLHSPVGEQYCDLWLVYIIDTLRNGHSLTDVDADTFLQTCDAAAMTDDGRVIATERRTELEALFEEVSLGPVVELVRLTDTDGTISLERTWYSMTPNQSPDEQLLAVRRALFRRHFFHALRIETRLNEVRASRQAAIERVIRGASLADVALYDHTFSPTARLAEQGPSAHETARKTLLGTHTTPEQLDAWLNDPDYGFEPQRKNHQSTA